MASVYILYSPTINTFYTGSCNDLQERLSHHRNKTFSTAFTAKADDWELYLSIDNLEYQQARNIESHIKKMKSRKYIQNLLKFPDIIKRLTEKY
ncbi:MAG: GIY-YIG nuclease family protein [Bacteroidales bacterium]|nr:GIY-YIG nuclease family protein [Bacteroidales bacterium]